VNQPTDYEFSDAKPSDAETVRRFLAKAYGEDHPAMEAFRRMECCSSKSVPQEIVERWVASPWLHVRNHPADGSHLPRKTTDATREWWDHQRTLHGDFGAMEFTKKQDHESCSHWGFVRLD